MCWWQATVGIENVVFNSAQFAELSLRIAFNLHLKLGGRRKAESQGSLG
jgi:hypothetical protein